MQNRIPNLPRTAIELFNFLPEGLWCQLIDGGIYVSPAVTFEHQSVIIEIQSGIYSHLKKQKIGVTVMGPIDVILDDRNAFQPDIIYISNRNRSIIKDDGKIHGAPDLIVEVLLPSSAKFDKGKKMKAYQACGVKEYFIVHPSLKEVISYYLIDGKFEQGTKRKGQINSKLLKKVFRF